ncbi:MAG: hypothetical protein K2Q22_16600, partial [Cytophagales bacterium]|nr:hypothetical protein [Cytophagales bacterium]
MKNFIFVLLVLLISSSATGQTITPAVNNVGGGSFKTALYQLDFSIGETSIKTINSPVNQITEGVIQRLESTCNTPVLTISGALTVCPSVSGFYSVRKPTRTSSYTWNISGQGTIVSGQGTSRIFVKFGSTAQDLISVQETTKDGCVGPAYSVQLSPSSGRYATPDLNLNCSTTLVSIPVLAISSIPSGIVAMDLTLGYDQLLMTPTGVSFLGNVVKQNFSNGAINLYTDYTQLGLIKVSISYSSLAPQTAIFAGLGTIIGFNFTRTPAFVPGGSTSLNIIELIEGNVSGVNYQCGTNGLISLRNNEITGILS